MKKKKKIDQSMASKDSQVDESISFPQKSTMQNNFLVYKRQTFMYFQNCTAHTTYSKNIMLQKCGGICGLWVWELPAKQLSQSSPFPLKLGSIGCAIQQVTSKRHPRFFSNFQHSFLFKKQNDPTNHFCARIPATYYF